MAMNIAENYILREMNSHVDLLLLVLKINYIVKQFSFDLVTRPRRLRDGKRGMGTRLHCIRMIKNTVP